MTILLTGSLAIDRIMVFPGKFQEHILPDQIHNLNVSFNIDELKEYRGGTAANIAYSLSLLGERPRIIASAGNDFDAYITHLEHNHLPIDGIEIQADVKTASAYIITDLEDNQINGFHMGAMAVETTASLAVYPANDTIIVLSPGNKADMIRYAQEARDLGMKYMFDPGQTLPFMEPEEIAEVMNGAYMLVVNDYELEMIKKRVQVTEEQIVAQVGFLLTTLAKNGSTIRSTTEEIVIDACTTTELKDPTGAGDAYRAGIIKGIMLQCDLQTMGQLGSTAAVYAVEQFGTQEHSFTIQKFAERYMAQFGTPCPLQ